MKYRIQVEELNNGKKEYTPEVGFEEKIIWGLLNRTEWRNILKDNHGGFTIGKHTRYMYETIGEAEDAITEYKEWQVTEVGKEVKTTSHVGGVTLDPDYMFQGDTITYEGNKYIKI